MGRLTTLQDLAHDGELCIGRVPLPRLPSCDFAAARRCTQLLAFVSARTVACAFHSVAKVELRAELRQGDLWHDCLIGGLWAGSRGRGVYLRAHEHSDFGQLEGGLKF